MSSEHKVKNLYPCPPICANELMGITFSDQYDLSYGSRLIHFYQVGRGAIMNMIGVLEGYIGGRQINELLHVLKPNKAGFGIDTQDLLNDWGNIVLPHNALRLMKHEAMRGFRDFMRERPVLLDQVQRAYYGDGFWNREKPNTGVRAVMWWKDKRDGPSEIVFDSIITRTKSAAYRQLISEHLREGEDPAILSAVVGTWLIAYFSPNVRANEQLWKSRDGYGNGCESQNNMGTTQVGGMALRYADIFLDDNFIPAAREYIYQHRVT